MNVCRYFAAFLVVTFLSLTQACRATNFESTETVTNDTNRVAANNSGQNKDQDSVTAEQQSNSPGDINITKEIRRSVERNNNLSEMAKNVKIITVNGAVTLRGPVKTLGEKTSIEQMARKVAGVNRVHDQLDVKNNQ